MGGSPFSGVGKFGELGDRPNVFHALGHIERGSFAAFLACRTAQYLASFRRKLTSRPATQSPPPQICDAV